MRVGQIDSADGIRGMALLIVVFLHATGLFFPGAHGYLGGTAQPGVWLFFILSSFLLTNKFCQRGFDFSEVMSYFLGRALRILPVFFVAALVYYWCGMYDFDKLISIISFNGTYVHLWTIPVEFCFYFILPAICFFSLVVRKKFGLYSSLIFISMLAAISSFVYPFTDLSYQGTTRWYLPVFIFGMIISFVYFFTKIEFKWWAADLLSVAIVFIFIMLSPSFFSEISGSNKNGWFTNAFVILSPIIALFVFIQTTSKGVVNFILSSQLMRKIGKFSFSIYLFHILVLFKISPNYKNDFPMYVISILLCFGLGIIMYYCFESPMETLRIKIMNFVRLKKTINNKKTNYYTN